MEIIIQGKVAFETTNFGWVWSGVSLANQIERFFDHQYLWKERIVILMFLHGDNH